MKAGKYPIGRILNIDPALLEMAEVFRMPADARLRYLYLPALTGKSRVRLPEGGDSEAPTAPSRKEEEQ